MKSYITQAILLSCALISVMSMQGFIDPVQLNKLPVDQRIQIKNIYSQIQNEVINGQVSLDELIAQLNNGNYLDRVGLSLDKIKNRAFRQYILALEESIERKVQELRQTLQDDRRVKNALSDWFNQESQSIARSFGGS